MKLTRTILKAAFAHLNFLSLLEDDDVVSDRGVVVLQDDELTDKVIKECVHGT